MISAPCQRTQGCLPHICRIEYIYRMHLVGNQAIHMQFYILLLQHMLHDSPIAEMLSFLMIVQYAYILHSSLCCSCCAYCNLKQIIMNGTCIHMLAVYMCHPYTSLLTLANVIVRSTSDYIMNYSNYISCVYK